MPLTEQINTLMEITFRFIALHVQVMTNILVIQDQAQWLVHWRLTNCCVVHIKLWLEMWLIMLNQVSSITWDCTPMEINVQSSTNLSIVPNNLRYLSCEAKTLYFLACQCISEALSSNKCNVRIQHYALLSRQVHHLRPFSSTRFGPFPQH